MLGLLICVLYPNTSRN